MYPNLYAELGRIGMSKRDLAPVIDVAPKTMYEKLAGKSPLHWVEAKKIRDEVFPTLTVDYLFSETQNESSRDASMYTFLKGAR